MAVYAKFLGLLVNVTYRVNDIHLHASGTLVGDSGRSIFLEQHLEQRGRVNYFRWEIPYQHVHRIAEASDSVEPPAGTPSTADASLEEGFPEETYEELRSRPAARAATASANSSPALPHHPKIA
jgi:hypothetical protein